MLNGFGFFKRLAMETTCALGTQFGYRLLQKTMEVQFAISLNIRSRITCSVLLSPKRLPQLRRLLLRQQ